MADFDKNVKQGLIFFSIDFEFRNLSTCALLCVFKLREKKSTKGIATPRT